MPNSELATLPSVLSHMPPISYPSAPYSPTPMHLPLSPPNLHFLTCNLESASPDYPLNPRFPAVRGHRLDQGVEQFIYHRRNGFFCPVFFTAQLSVLPKQLSVLPNDLHCRSNVLYCPAFFYAEASISWMPDSS